MTSLETRLSRLRQEIDTTRQTLQGSSTHALQLDIFAALHNISTLSAHAQQLHTFRAAGISTFHVSIQAGRREKSRRDIAQKGLGVRIEVFVYGRYLEPFYLILSKPKNGTEETVHVNHHTIPSFIDLDALGRRYLGWKGGNASVSLTRQPPSSINTWHFIDSIHQQLTSFAKRRHQATLCKQHLSALGDSLQITANEGYQTIQIEWNVDALEILTVQASGESGSGGSGGSRGSRGSRSTHSLGRLPYKRSVRVQLEFDNLLYSHLHHSAHRRGGKVSVEIIVSSLPLTSLRGCESKPPLVFPQDYDHIFWPNATNATNANAIWMVDLHEGVQRVATAIRDGDYVASYPTRVKIAPEHPPQPYDLEDDELLPCERAALEAERVQQRTRLTEPEDDHIWDDVQHAYDEFQENWNNMPNQDRLQRHASGRANPQTWEYERQWTSTYAPRLEDLRNEIDGALTENGRENAARFNAVEDVLPQLQESESESSSEHSGSPDTDATGTSSTRRRRRVEEDREEMQRYVSSVRRRRGAVEEEESDADADAHALESNYAAQINTARRTEARERRRALRRVARERRG
ncbi:hypothetical protein E3P99_00821 [Wallemia hederae]|uniref:Uncharacterized protein n=1 Tax=Wallemia hederae TaxID=1540922 RepID=A0A4T0FY54_9BASI|nr:hypothetical protein E3P99_00821 [Wallemia hederae]